LVTTSTPNGRLSYTASNLHCKEISIYVFPEKEGRGLGTNFHIHVSVSDLCIPAIGDPAAEYAD
jgi:hypothetical protein